MILYQCPRNDEKMKQMEKVLYASVIGSLMHSILCTQLDLSFLTKLVNHCYNPNLILYEQLKGFFLLFQGDYRSLPLL